VDERRGTQHDARTAEGGPDATGRDTVAVPRAPEAVGPSRGMTAIVITALIGAGIGAGATWLAVRPGASASPVAAPAAAGAGTHEAAAPPAGASQAVYISPARQQLIGVRTAVVEHRALETTIRTVGMLAYDETRVTQIHPKVSGWIERLYVDFVGKSVRRGQPLLTIYSPELVATQNEYLLALKAQRQLGESAFPETREGAASLLAATRARLRLWDITDGQIAEIESTGEARRTLTIYSPFDGVVLERNVFAGQYITPETNTVKIADLSRIWVMGQLFEYETSRVTVGQVAAIEFPYGQSKRTLSGRITFIYPDVDPQTRRIRVRAEFSNPGLELKPDTYVTVIVRGSAGHQLAIPREAVIDTGARRYALLALPNGYFEPREIQVGEPVDELYPVLSGLTQGDEVVTSAQFLVDSETNLQAAMQSMAGHGHGGMAMPEPGAAGTAPPPEAAAPPVNHSQHRP